MNLDVIVGLVCAALIAIFCLFQASYAPGDTARYWFWLTAFAVCVLTAFWILKVHYDRMDEKNPKATPPPEATQPTEAAPPGAALPEPPPLGEKTAGLILAHLQDVYRQEIVAEEDVHRTLPFFATALGLIVTSLSYSATQLPSWRAILKSCSPSGPPAIIWQIIPCAWSALLAEMFLLFVLCLSGAVLWYLGLATMGRDYTRVGPEPMIVEGTRDLHAAHALNGLAGEQLDTTVATDVRTQLLDPFSSAVAANREVTLQRYRYRGRAVWCLLLSLLFAFLAIILIVVTTKFGTIEASP